MSKVDTSGLFENFVLVSLTVTKYGHIKTCKELAEEGAKVLTIEQDRAKGAVSLIDDSIIRYINKPIAQAREYMKGITVPWSASRVNANGSRVSGSEYLLAPEKIQEYRDRMAEFRMEWERRLEKHLFKQWDYFRARALTDLNGRFQEHFIPLEELREKFNWDADPRMLDEAPDLSNDIRLKAPQEVIDKCVEETKRRQAMKISNAVGSIADSVMDEANEIVKGIDSYVFVPGNNRTGNHLPKQKGWERLERLADRIDEFTKALDDENLTDASNKIRQLVDDIRSLGDGSLKEARKKLSGEDDTERQKVKEKLSEIKDATAPATNRLEDFLS